MRIKLILLVLLITITVVLGACGADSDQSRQDNTQTPEQAPADASINTPELTPTSTPVPTTVPDFADVDFTGKWHVTQIIDSNGETVSESQIESLNPGFILELLKNGVYFVYDKDNEILGQGDYVIQLNQLTLTAAEQQTVYEVHDEDTLWCESPDKSVTVMTRIVEENEPDNAYNEDGDDSDDVSQA